MTNVKTLSAPVDDWVQATKKRMIAVRNASIEKVVNAAQLPTGKGGRMRVDTGFLRASGQMTLNGFPTGPIRGDDDATKYFYDDGERPGSEVTPVALILARASLGTDIYFGWTANYARYRESQDGFLRLAAQRWPDFVAESTKTAKSRSGNR